MDKNSSEEICGTAHFVPAVVELFETFDELRAERIWADIIRVAIGVRCDVATAMSRSVSKKRLQEVVKSGRKAQFPRMRESTWSVIVRAIEELTNDGRALI
jgi:hypothetical protein